MFELYLKELVGVSQATKRVGNGKGSQKKIVHFFLENSTHRKTEWCVRGMYGISIQEYQVQGRNEGDMRLQWSLISWKVVFYFREHVLHPIGNKKLLKKNAEAITNQK